MQSEETQTPEYIITTLKDIFDNVPSEKIPACMGELAAFMVQLKVFHEQNTEGASVEFPSELKWVDNGDNNVVIKDEQES